MDAPAWLTPHLREGEQVRWVHDPGPEGWRRAIVGIALWAWLTFWVGFSMPSWWQLLPIWPERSVSPVVGALLAGIGFLGDAATSVLRHRYTGYAVTDQRLLRVHLEHSLARLVPVAKPDAWPLGQVSIAEKERARGGHRVRLEVRSPAGKRLARFRLRVADEPALRAALRAPPPQAA